MISKEIIEEIRKFIEDNAKGFETEYKESNVYRLEDIIGKENIMQELKNKFEEGKFGVYFIINAGNTDISEEKIIEIEESDSKFKYKYEKSKLEDKVRNLKNVDEYLRKILYIGKAGGEKNSDLYNRLGLYMKYGVGKAQNHKGGRAIWQIDEETRKNLYVFWIYVNGDKAYEKAGKLETLLLQEYNKRVSEKLLSSNVRKSFKYPFANWRC